MSKYLGMAEQVDKVAERWMYIGPVKSTEVGALFDAAHALREADALLSACDLYLKDGETPAERIERERRDNAGVLSLLAQERLRIAELEAALRLCEGLIAGAADPRDKKWVLEKARTALEGKE